MSPIDFHSIYGSQWGSEFINIWVTDILPNIFLYDLNKVNIAFPNQKGQPLIHLINCSAKFDLFHAI